MCFLTAAKDKGKAKDVFYWIIVAAVWLEDYCFKIKAEINGALKDNQVQVNGQRMQLI